MKKKLNKLIVFLIIFVNFPDLNAIEVKVLAMVNNKPITSYELKNKILTQIILSNQTLDQTTIDKSKNAAIHVPSMIIELMPFIIFISSMWLLINMRDKRELLTFKIYGYSNFKIFLIIGLFSFELIHPSLPLFIAVRLALHFFVAASKPIFFISCET